MATKMDPTQIASTSSSKPETGEDDDIGNVSNSITGSSSFNSGNVNVNDSIVCEILSRLPVKSLMQLKCLSKHWCSMIWKDRYFIDLQLNQSKARPCLFIKVPRAREDYKNYTREDHDNILYPIGYYLVIADLLLEGGEVSPVVRNIREIDTPSSRIVGPLNGLICFFDSAKNHSVQVCNLSTREVTPWIKSTFISNLNLEDKDKNRLRLARSRCNVGFDPATKEHKVICIWNIFHHRVCEVMTVGDGKWRRINDLPAYDFREPFYFGASTYVNGSIYYYSPEKPHFFFNRDFNLDDIGKFIVAFDVGEEKFRSIWIPDFILNQISQRFQPAVISVQLLEIDGHPALLSAMSRGTVKLWLFDNKYNNGYKTSTWTEVTIELPFYLGYGDDEYSVHFHSVIGTDFIILYLYVSGMSANGYHYAHGVSQYSYDWKKKIFAEIKIDGLPSSIPYFDFVSDVSTFAESLSPVQ